MSTSRAALDARFRDLVSIRDLFAKPKGGWVKAIRAAIGMSQSELAARVGVTSSTLSRIEANEMAGISNLETLQKVADALECDLVYAILPRAGLHDQVVNRAEALAKAYVDRVQQSMALEEQQLDDEALLRLKNQVATDLMTAKNLWRNDQA